MQAVRKVDTAPELGLRRALHRLGARYRVDVRPLPEVNRRADIVFRRQQLAVFVDGCFWHGCPEHGARQHHVNGWYWRSKIAGNVERDRDTDRRLREAGWHVIRIWEHENAAEAAEGIMRSLLALKTSDRAQSEAR